jgi:tripartite-type tricarboxylate transporter receptor subunit TctC
MITKRRFLQTAACAATALATPRAYAVGNPSYPSRSVKWVVPYAPGGATDVLSRLICQRLSDRLGQTFIVENKPGAGSNIGTQAVITSAPAFNYPHLVERAEGAHKPLQRRNRP